MSTIDAVCPTTANSVRRETARTNPDRMGTIECERFVEAIRNLPGMPGVVRRLLEVMNHPSSSAADVAEAFASDPDLAARILGLVNSSFYGFSYKITSIQRAVALLGFRPLRTLVLSLCVYENLRGSRAGGLDRHALWEHSLAVATCAASLARRTSVATVEDAYTAGLLHDLGKGLLDTCLGPKYKEALTARDGAPSSRTEKLAFGITHEEIGAILAERWRFPASLVEAIRRHHSADLAAIPEHQARNLAAIVGAADALAWQMGYPSLPGGERPSLDPVVAEVIDVFHVDRERLSDEVESEIERLTTVFTAEPVAPSAVPDRRPTRTARPPRHGGRR